MSEPNEFNADDDKYFSREPSNFGRRRAAAPPAEGSGPVTQGDRYREALEIIAKHSAEGFAHDQAVYALAEGQQLPLAARTVPYLAGLEGLVAKWRKAGRVCNGISAQISGETLIECADELESELARVRTK